MSTINHLTLNTGHILEITENSVDHDMLFTMKFICGEGGVIEKWMRKGMHMLGPCITIIFLCWLLPGRKAEIWISGERLQKTIRISFPSLSQMFRQERPMCATYYFLRSPCAWTFCTGQVTLRSVLHGWNCLINKRKGRYELPCSI